LVARLVRIDCGRSASVPALLEIPDLMGEYTADSSSVLVVWT
jgi:hypothetical protein